MTLFINDKTTLINLITNQSSSSNVTGTGVNCISYEGQLIVLLTVGAGGSGSLAVKLQESDTLGGTYTDIPGASFTTVTGSSAAQEKIAIWVKNNKPFIRAVATVTTGPYTFAVLALGQKKIQ